MSKNAHQISLAGIKVSRHGEQPMHQQLYESIRGAILGGRLKAGERMPASRVFCEELGISRNIVLLAFEQLALEGYLVGRTGSGTFVANTLPDALLRIKSRKKEPPIHTELLINTEADINPLPLPPDLLRRNSTKEVIKPFQTATPSFNDFPFAVWAKIAGKVLRYFNLAHLGYDDAAGYLPLRKAIANYLRVHRAVNCTAEQIIIVNGSQQGLNLIGQILLPRGEEFWLEDPGYHGARAALINAGGKCCPVPVSAPEGLDLNYAIKHYPQARMAYLTPSHQYPLGGTMPVCKRLELLDWANKNHMWLIEDDYDSEFRYTGKPLASLQGLDKGGRVIYLGTFSKVLFPALRIAYLVLPTLVLANHFRLHKAMLDRQHPLLEQLILTDFIQEGHFTRHLRRMRLLYKKRQDALLSSLHLYAPNLTYSNMNDSGMQSLVWLPEHLSDKAVSELLRQEEIIAPPLSDYTVTHFKKPGLLLGYSSFTEEQITQGIQKFARLVNGLL
ncbi:MocR-like pyridoxine biosynthesis transcription factor PdxR [Adhaeribacter pallidiroseus]|uniref:Putative rhizopine catabolism regulatory protein MocR n=1 Tax=Adhaeribacter pallidiroseus TaxID=2072847 RepID=A0A369QRL6_9BACT|nr:PLP-dependent aminotransferase family protein [Adhaeribacter pallidiroseus]RDC65956.1 putative rhizopine catabolism regulatory protein MocR [Adhaeribacter pallidiroseus]